MKCDGNAVISRCEKYRYLLTRQWANSRPDQVLWIMLNPSTADATQNDSTIRKCMGFSARIGYQRLAVVNLFAHRSTSPLDMKKAANPIGPDNDTFIRQEIAKSAIIIAAWGAHGDFQDRGLQVMKMVRPRSAVCFGKTENNQPLHPLLIEYARKLRPYWEKE